MSSPPFWRTVFESPAVAAAAIITCAVILLVSEKAASFAVHHFLFGMANAVEKVLESHRCGHRLRAHRAGATYVGAASFITFSVAYNQRTRRHALPPPALEMAAPHTCSDCLRACAGCGLASSRVSNLVSSPSCTARQSMGRLSSFVDDRGRPQRVSPRRI